MKKYKIAILTISLCLFSASSVKAQTCCSGGVPVSSNLGLPPGQQGALQLNLSYDLNKLQTLNSGKEELNDDSRERTTHSILLELGYTFTKKIAVDALFTYVRQERNIEQNGFSDFTRSNGFGDAVLLFKYNLLNDEIRGSQLTIGIGPKLPLGSSTKRQQGIILNADLQPGSGAWDGIAWLQYFQSLAFRPSLSLFATLTHAIKGKNKNYLDGSQQYQFGNETQLSFGISDKLYLGKTIVDPSVGIRYRKAQEDEIDASSIPNTGGQWLFLDPGITLWLKDAMSVNVGMQIPLYAEVTGTQLTPTYRLNVGLYYKFVSRKKVNLP